MINRIFTIIILCLSFSVEANACSVCGFGQDGSQWAYIFTTGFMTILPLAMFFTALYFIYKYMKGPEADKDSTK